MSHFQRKEADAKSGQTVYLVPAVRYILLDGLGVLLEMQKPENGNDRQEGKLQSRTTVQKLPQQM
jgi:hypothetical protein